MQYIEWMDHHANRILRNEGTAPAPSPCLAGMQLSPEQLESWRQDFKSRRPTDWKSQGYGSDSFEESILNEVKGLQQEMASRRNKIPRGSPI